MRFLDLIVRPDGTLPRIGDTKQDAALTYFRARYAPDSARRLFHADERDEAHVFDKAAYAAIVKGVGFAALIVGGFAGGLVARALPLPQALWIAALLQMGSNLMFAWQAEIGVSHAALSATIIVENLTGALGTVIFVGYLSQLCDSPAHTATQFALLTALSAVGRTVLSLSSGFVAGAVGWTAFFIVSALIAVPALALLAYLHRKGYLPDTRTPPSPSPETSQGVAS